ncbi:60S ribosomal protein L31 [Brettanomyces nanus]|uniref:60S ribosomal protein L31 n=1 Tax=Eeniella nana TaxID=13502 RepID=A0A875S348_EENNA|nr:60S ribosomal protein L31 [Brettanomyces nanus]QPG74482.1 60S ribosomal protein L31 [Brettanomyces nanus]
MAAELKDPVTREYTINLHKRLHGETFKRRAPRAVKEIKKFAKLHMGTEDVRLDPKLNVALWKRGIQGVPTRMRLRISRKRNEEENAKTKMFSYVEPVIVASIKGLQTTVVEEEA